MWGTDHLIFSKHLITLAGTLKHIQNIFTWIFTRAHGILINQLIKKNPQKRSISIHKYITASLIQESRLRDQSEK